MNSLGSITPPPSPPEQWHPPAPTAAVSQVTCQIVNGTAKVVWTLPASAAHSSQAEATGSVTLTDGEVVNLTLQLKADGPTIGLIYCSYKVPTEVFDNFRVSVSGTGLGLVEMGGSSSDRGFEFWTGPLGERLPRPFGTIEFNFPVNKQGGTYA